MVSSIKRLLYFLGRTWRFGLDSMLQPMALGLMVLLLATSVASSATSPVVRALQAGPSQSPRSQSLETTPPLPLSASVRARLHHHHLATEAALTSHNLTAAHFFGRSSVNKLSAEAPVIPKQG